MKSINPCWGFLVLVLLAWSPCGLSVASAADAAAGNSRRPAGQDDLRSWLENMVWYHDFTNDEIAEATGLEVKQIEAAIKKFNITAENKPARPADAPLLVLPYPGGRHPRIGFLEGAIDPQRETKLSVFLPWKDAGYVVVDMPEAIWSNLGLTYLAHTHVPTVWTQKGVDLEPLEWTLNPDGSLKHHRRLPNGIEFGGRAESHPDHVTMDLWLKNGTPETLTGMRVQNCVMLKMAPGFNAQIKDNKTVHGPYIACRSEEGDRYIITAWTPLNREWGNDLCPCMHSDPEFPDAEPGETVRVQGWLSFYEGDDLESEIKRIDQTGWHSQAKAD